MYKKFSFYVVLVAVLLFFVGCGNKYNTPFENIDLSNENISQIIGSDLAVTFIVSEKQDIIIDSIDEKSISSYNIKTINAYNDSKDHKNSYMSCIKINQDNTFDKCSNKIRVNIYTKRELNLTRDPISAVFDIAISPLALVVDTLDGNTDLKYTKNHLSTKVYDQDSANKIGKVINTLIVRDYKDSKTYTALNSFINRFSLDVKYGTQLYHKRENLKFADIEKYRKLNTEQGYKDAFYLSKDEQDLEKIVSYQTNIDKLKDFLQDYSSSSSFLAYKAAKEKLIKSYRSEKSLNGYKEAYSLSQNDEDLKNLLSYKNSIKELKDFINNYSSSSYSVQKIAKSKLAKKYRKLNSFDGFFNAYDISNDNLDLKNAYSKANTPRQKATVEKLAFAKISNKESLVKATLSLSNPSFSKSDDGGGMFSQSSQYGYVSVYGNVNIAFDKNNLPFIPKYGKYKVEVSLKLTIPRYKQVRSNWVGNKDTKANNVLTKKLYTYLTPPYSKTYNSFTFNKATFVYFNRGSAGGFTAIWPSDYPNVKITNISISYVSQYESNNKNLYIDFTKLSNYSRSINYPTAYVQKAYKKGFDWINNFAHNEIGRYKDYGSSGYSSSSSSSSTSSSYGSRSSSSNNSSSSSSSSGVKTFYDAGTKSSKGFTIYMVKCNSGMSYTVFKDNDGFLKDGVGFNYGEDYKNMSIKEFARSKCK